VTGDDSRSEDPQVGSLVRTGAAWKLASQGVMQVLRLLVGLVLAHLLSPSDYGVASVALLVTGFVLVFSDLSFGAAIVQRTTVSERDLATMFWVSLAAGALFTLVGIAVSGLVAAAFDEPALKGLFAVMSLTFVITSLGATQRAVLTRSMSFRELELRMMSGTAIGGIVGVVVAVSGGGPWAIIAQQVAFSVVSTGLLWATCRWRPSLRFSWQSARDLGGYSGNVLGNRLVLVAQDTSNTALIGKLLGPQSLGLFAVANNLVLIPLSSIVNPVADVLFPAFSRLQEEKARIGSLWLGSLPYAAAIAVPSLLGLIVVAPDFVAVALGSKWTDVTPVLQVLAILGIARALQGWNSVIVMALDRVGFLLQISIWSLIVSVCAVAIGCFFGTVGVAVSLTVFSILFVQLPWWWYVTRLVGATLFDVVRALAGVIEASVIMAVVVFGFRVALVELGASAVVRLVASIVVGIGVYTVACRWRAPEVYKRARDVAIRRLRGRSQPAVGAGRAGG
jgi:O-antigen/teichoic acid export membrane protein